MGYIIIVKKDGRYVFETSEHSIGYDKDLAKLAYDRINIAFPKSEGFDVQIVRRYSGDDKIDPNTL